MKPDALTHLADALMEDIVATPPHQLAIEEIVDAGRSRELVFRFDDILAEASTPPGQPSAPLAGSALWNLADALCEDIAAHADEPVLMEVSDERSDDRSLAGKFDDILRRDPHLAVAGLRMPPRSGRSHPAFRVTAALARLPGRLIAPLHGRVAAGALAMAATAVLAMVVVRQPPYQTMMHQTMQPEPFAGAQSPAAARPAEENAAKSVAALPAPAIAADAAELRAAASPPPPQSPAPARPAPPPAEVANAGNAAKAAAASPPPAIAADGSNMRVAAVSPPPPRPAPPVPAAAASAGSAAKPAAPSPLPVVAADGPGDSDAARRRLDALEESLRHIREENDRKIADAETRIAEEQTRLLALKQRQEADKSKRRESVRSPQEERKRQDALLPQADEERRQETPRRGAAAVVASQALDSPLAPQRFAAQPAPAAAVPRSANAEAGLKSLEDAARRGSVTAMSRLGRIYADGDGVLQDHRRAFEYFRRITESEAAGTVDDADGAKTRVIANAFVETGRYSLTGLADSEVKPDPERARQMFTHAATALDDPDAQYELGRMYLSGKGVARDQKRGMQWLQMAAIKGQYEAQAALGSLLFRGEGMLRDAVKGLAWLKLAMDAAPRGDARIADLYNAAWKQATEKDRTAARAVAEQWRSGQGGSVSDRGRAVLRAAPAAPPQASGGRAPNAQATGVDF